MKTKLIVLVSACIATGCATTIKGYRGTARPASQLARLGSVEHVLLDLDYAERGGNLSGANEYREGLEYSIEAPAHHKIIAKYYNAAWRDTANDGTTVTRTLSVDRSGSARLEFDSLPGHYIQIAFRTCGAQKRFYVLDEKDVKQHIAAQKAAKKGVMQGSQLVTMAELDLYCRSSCNPDPECPALVAAYPIAVKEGRLP